MCTEHKFSCFIIGEGTLPIQCAEILLEREHDIYGIISPDTLLKRWAEERDIPHLGPENNLLSFLSRQVFDYLFSIVNGYVLTEEIIALPRQKAINYHDAPLPRYAGNYATSWAIMQREMIHGVTWHVMTEQIDAGDILKQTYVDISTDETALTLNTKCYNAAITSFAELVEDLAYGRVSAKQQNLDERTYFPLYKRPPAGCVISWNQSAQDIDAFVRGLEFGPYPNPLGLPKLALGRKFIIVSKLDVLDSLSEVPPGTITDIADDSLTISTATHQVALRRLLTIDGQPLSIIEAVAQFGLYKEYKFEDLDQELSDRLTASNALICKHEPFWVERLATLQPITLSHTVPTASLHSLRPQYTIGHEEPERYARLPVPIPAEVTTFLANQHPTWRMDNFLSAASVAYLIRLGGVDCFDIGFRAVERQPEGRRQHDLAGLEGFFASHVPLRVDVDLAWRFEQVYDAIRAQVELVKQHHTYARDVVARYPELGAVPESPGEHVWPVIIEQVERLDDYRAMPGSEFIVIISEDGSLHWVYDPEVFDEDSIHSMLRQFTTLLRSIVATNAEQPLWTLPLLTEAEQRQLLVEWNDTSADYPRDQCIYHLFEAQAARTPDATAVVFEGEGLTYRELDRRANQLAHYLRALGVGPETLVGICVERSLEMVIGLLGILKAGGAYVPLDPAYPQERLAFMIADSQMSMLLTQQRLMASLAEHETKVICLDSDWPQIALQCATKPVSGVMPENLAYAIYTSGSTGTPKGVLIPHRALVNHNVAVAKEYQLQSRDRVLQFASISFDAAAEEIFPSLLVGATIVLRPEEILDSFTDFVQFLAAEKVTVLDLPTSYWHEWVADLARSKTELPDSLRLVIVGAEQALPESLALWDKLVGDRIQWINSYGPTEATIVATVYHHSNVQARSTQHTARSTIPIGRPIANIQAYILDHHLQPVPIGVPGELHLGGIGLARGYLNRPELTAEKFISNPFSNKPNARLYKTGDLARYLPDGNIEFLGRRDHQVKIRGYRVELGEIEATLNKYPLVKESIVIAYDNGVGGKGLAAYVIPIHQRLLSDEEAGLSTTDLRSYLQGQLPNYMIPSVFRLLDALPLTPSGKLDRRNLPAPKASDAEREKSYVAPRTSIEEMLADLWADVLGVKRVGIHDNFFELGGNSLQAVQLVSRIIAEMGCDISVRTIFVHPTVEVLADALQQLFAMPSKKEVVPTEPSKGMSAEQFPSSLMIDHRPLLSLFAAGKIGAVDAAALDYLEHANLECDQFIRDWCEGLPLVTDVIETSLGHVAVITLPRFDVELYNEDNLVGIIVEAVEMARQLGARTVSLTGLIPSATDYGRAVIPAVSKRKGLPSISTGHATTVATVVLTIKRILQESGRDLSREWVGFLGLGSIGMASLQLMLKQLPHPRSITLCDVYDTLDLLERVKQECINDLGFQGMVQIIESQQKVPPEFYEATLVIGATNVQHILDIAQLKPGTMIVDDSAPHCFNPKLAAQRFQAQADILFTEAGVLQSPQPVIRRIYLPRSAEQTLNSRQLEAFFTRRYPSKYLPSAITGCIFSSLLSARFERLKPTVGLVDLTASLQHYEMLNHLKFQAADLHCEDKLHKELIHEFKYRFGGKGE